MTTCPPLKEIELGRRLLNRRILQILDEIN